MPAAQGTLRDLGNCPPDEAPISWREGGRFGLRPRAVDQILLLLDQSSPEVLAVDLKLPDNAATLAASLRELWPRLEGRVRYVESNIGEVELTADDLVVSVHACGQLTDRVLARAVVAGARVAVLSCCHNLAIAESGELQGWMDGPPAVDATRVFRLQAAGYRAYTQTIPVEITPKNRLLLAEPGPDFSPK